MPVSEYGEIGCFIEYTEHEDRQGVKQGLVIEWRIRKIAVAKTDNGTWSWKVGDKIYQTSRGWMTASDEVVFMPRGKERSLKPCLLRALDYAKAKYPGVRVETH